MNREVLVIEDEGLIVMCLKNEKGGPIISGYDFEEVKQKFEEALNLSISIKKLMTFKEKGRF